MFTGKTNNVPKYVFLYKNVTFRLLQTIYALAFVRSYGKTQYVEMN